MAEVTLGGLLQRLDRHQRLMGLDLGSKTIGLALSDTTRLIASPAELIRRRKFARDAEELIGFIQKHDIGALVYGLPRNMDGTEGPRCQSTRQFARNFDERCALPYVFWDERLSTAAVERSLIGEADMTRARRAEVIDKAAAAYILQGALDALRHAAGRPSGA